MSETDSGLLEEMSAVQYNDGRFAGTNRKPVNRPLLQNRLKPRPALGVGVISPADRAAIVLANAPTRAAPAPAVGEHFAAESDDDESAVAIRRRRKWKNDPGTSARMHCCQLLLHIIATGCLVIIVISLFQDSEVLEKLGVRVNGYMDDVDRSRLFPLLTDIRRNYTDVWSPTLLKTLDRVDAISSASANLVEGMTNQSFAAELHGMLTEVHALIGHINHTLSQSALHFNVQM